jgi:CubicO group peptidase (beta-lactamase class C family)
MPTGGRNLDAAYNSTMIRWLLVCVLISGRVVWAADVKGELHEYFQQACQSKGFMGAASVTVNGDTMFSEACGWADAEWKIENTVETRFRTGSVGKQFTAASVLLLHEQGKLSFSDPIGKYLPDLPESWRSATIHQLLTHTSGVPIPSYAGPEWERFSALATTPTEFLDLVRDKPLLYPHGTRLTYNNTGCILLGMTIEKVSGMKYEYFVQERIFDRLGMRGRGCCSARPCQMAPKGNQPREGNEEFHRRRQP